MAMIKNDATIATEMFVELFGELYKAINEQQLRNQLGAGVRKIL